MTKLLLALVCLAASLPVVEGCSSSTVSPGATGGTSGGSSCTVTLAGGVASTHSCAVTFAYDGTLTATDFSLSTTNIDPQTVPKLDASIQLAGQPTLGAVLSTDASVLQGLLVINAEDSTDAWSADAASADTAATGSFTLAITALGTAISAGGSSFYTNTHGSLDAVLLPVTAGQTTPAITAHADF